MHDNPSTDVGSRIHARRAELGYSLRDLADRTAMTRGYLSKVENGQIQSANHDNLARIADALELPLTTLLGIDLPDLDTYLRVKYHDPNDAYRAIRNYLTWIDQRLGPQDGEDEQ